MMDVPSAPASVRPLARVAWEDAASWAAVALGVLLWVASWFGLDPTNVPQRMDFRSFHFPSLRVFAERPFAEAIVDYPAAPFPLFYVLGGAIYRVTGSVSSLRLFTVALGIGVLSCIARLGRAAVPGRSRWLVAATLVSPYFRGQSVYANTDVLALLFAAFALAVFGERAPRVPGVRAFAALGLACGAVYTRQFYVFVPAALLVRLASERSLREAAFGGAYCAVLAAPLVALVVAWRGVTPPGFRQHAALSFVDSVPVVLALMAFYVSPLALVTAWKCRGELAREIRRPAFIAMVSPLLVFCAHLVLARHQVPDVVGGGLPVHLLKALPLGDGARSALFALVVALGGSYLVYLLLQAPAKNAILLLIALAFAPTSILYQRYFDPLLPIVSVAVLSVRELAGPRARLVVILAVVLELTVTAIGAAYYRQVFASAT